jgi:hypothetical protein
LKFIKKVFLVFSKDFDNKYKAIESETNIERKKLDKRLTEVARATLDGEDKWFLQLAKTDPECVLQVIKDCGVKGEENDK